MMGAISLGASLCAGASILALLVSQPASAKPQTPTVGTRGQQFRFEVPAQRLDGALRAVARTAGAEIIFNREAVARYASRKLVGTLTVEQALAQLVRGTSLVVGRSPAGVFTIQAAPPILRTEQAPPPASPPADALAAQPLTPADEIIVTGFRQSLENAQAIKRNSDQIVDSVVAEDIGKLPDATGAETLARVPGVSVERLNGEAASVRVRGLPDLTTTYNGREIFTAEGRSVALQDFPAGTISRFDVYKTAAANLIEAGIAGEIDVRSRKPFDFKDFRIAGGVTGLHWRQSQRFGVDASFLASKRWDTGIGEIGILIEGSYTDNNFIDAQRTNNQSILIRGTTATFPRHRYPSVVTFEMPTSTRWRPSASAAIQWRPSPDLEFYGDFLFQGFRGRGESRALQVGTGTGAVIDQVTLCPGSTTLICQMRATGGNATGAYQQGQWANTDTFQGGGGFIWKIGGGRVTGDIALTDSTNMSVFKQMAAVTNIAGTRIFNFDDAAGGGGGSAQVFGVDLANPAAWRLNGYSYTNAYNHGRSVQARLDADMPVELSIIDRIQAGLRFSNRDTESEAVNSTVNPPGAPTAAQLAAWQFTALGLDYAMAPIAFRGDPTAHPRTWLTPTPQTVIDNWGRIRTLMGQPATDPARIPTYTANEKSYAAYLQAHYAFDIGSITVDGQIGIRAVRTTNQLAGTRSITQGTVTDIVPFSRSVQYNDYLPNISARLRLTPKLQARLAFTKTRTRPSFGQLNPTITIGNPAGICTSEPDSLSCFRSASSGNPDLKPVESTNYDASLEYYFSRSGSATVQVFRRDVTGFINNRTLVYTDPALGRISLSQPENGEKGRIQGVEAGFRTFLRIPSLPQWAQNFGVLANYTYLDHGSELSQAVAATLPGMQPITNTSSHLANAQLFYETKALSLRLSYNYRSSFQTYNLVNDNALAAAFYPCAAPPTPTCAIPAQGTFPVTEEGRGTLDLSGTLNPTDNISLTFNIANLTGAPARTSRIFNREGESYPWQVRYLETVYRLGLRFRF